MTETAQPVLLVEGGPERDKTIKLGPMIGMGRHPSVDVFVDDESVSRRHAEIVESRGVYHLQDLSSRNGTFVNGARVGAKGHVLKDGDTISLGGSEISHVFCVPPPETQQVTVTLSSVEGDTKGPEDAPDEPYQGTVRLRLVAQAGMWQVLGFRNRLLERPEFRLVRMVRLDGGDMELWIGLRKPVALAENLREIEGVADVSQTAGRDLAPGSEDRPLTVQLETYLRPERPTCVHCDALLTPRLAVCPRCRKSQPSVAL